MPEVHHRVSNWMNIELGNHNDGPRAVTPPPLTTPPSPPRSPYAVAPRPQPRAGAFQAFPTIPDAPVDRQPFADRVELRRKVLERALNELVVIQLGIVSSRETQLLLAINAVESELRRQRSAGVNAQQIVLLLALKHQPTKSPVRDRS